MRATWRELYVSPPELIRHKRQVRRWARLLEKVDSGGAGDGGSGRVCKLTLLPLDPASAAAGLRWGREVYLVAAANLWAHRVSPDPPRLCSAG